MTRQQQTAIENPCEFAEECADRKYGRFATVGGLTISTVVTLNVGQE